MSVVSQNIPGRSIVERFNAMFKVIVDWTNRKSNAGRAAQDAAAMMRLSDRELNDIGLNRGQIIRHAFGKRGYY